MSDSLQPHQLEPPKLFCPWDSPGKNIGVGCHSLLQGIFPTQRLNQYLLHCRQILYQLLIYSQTQISMIVISFGNQKHGIYYTRAGIKGKKWHGNKDLIKHLFVEVNLLLLLLYCIAISSGFTSSSSLRN